MTVENDGTKSGFQERTPSGDFIYQIFDESKNLIEREKGASVVAEVKSRFARRWGGDSAFNLVRGLLLRSDRHDYGLVIGTVGFGSQPDDGFGLQFGKIAHLGRPFEDTLKHWATYPEQRTQEELKSNYLDAIVHQPRGAFGSGRFYVKDGLVEVDCWVDRREFGGLEVGKFPYGEPNSVYGFLHYVDIVREVANRSWR